MLSTIRPTAVALAALLTLGAAPAVAAQAQKSDPTPLPATAPQDAPNAERPWAKGVSPELQKKALALFREGNALLKDSVFVQAANKYREALVSWDHPAIHYNLVLALLNLDQPIEVHEHLLSSIKYGPEPLDLEKFEQAKAYKILVEKQLARVQIDCQLPGAQVVMDGRPLFTAPGKWEGFVRPGPHSILASKEGYITNETSRSLPAGETVALALELLTTADLTTYKRRWDLWKPWAVLGAGVVVAGVGGGLHYTGTQSVRDFDTGIEECGGCIPSDELASKRDSGATMQSVAVGAYAVGGAAAVAGAVLVYVNRLLPYQIDGSVAAEPEQSPVSLVPMIDSDARGVAATFRF